MQTGKPEQDKILEHEYDGIQEYDNPMPRWWIWVFWATIIFSVAYAFDFTGTLRGPGREKEYEAELAEAERRWPQQSGGADAEALAALMTDQGALESGKAVYAQNCAACHRADGGGLIGPNLTDDHWLHGGTLVEIHKTIAEGVLAKGMPAWEKILKPEQLDAVTVYVASLHGTNPPSPKAPEGEKVER
jgi:cytochrome c oxidase cbb3-type subunit 3